MDIRHRLYPYPVLSETTDDYINSNFNMELQVSQGIREICFTISLKLTNNEIQQMIYNGLAEYVIHIECPYTAYRTVIKTDETEITKNIPEHKLNGKVAVCAFIVAKQDIPQYYNSCFNEDYEKLTFNLHRGNIVAIGGQTNITVTKEIEELSKIPSIFTICKCAADTDDSMKIEISGEKIAITLCNRSFGNYKMLSAMPSMLPVLHSMLIVPKYEDLRWFKSVSRTLKKNNMSLDQETLENIPSFELAQKSLDLPIDRALEALTSQGMADEEE